MEGTDVIILSQVHGTLSGFCSRREKRPRNKSEEERKGKEKVPGTLDLETVSFGAAAPQVLPSLCVLVLFHSSLFLLVPKHHCGRWGKRG